MNFIKIPNNLINDVTYIKRYGKRLPYVVTELILHENKMNVSVFSLNNLIVRSGIKPRKGKGNSNEQFRELFKMLIDNGIVELIDSLKDIEINKMIECKLNIPYDYNANGQSVGWFKVNIQDYLKIINSKNKLNRITTINLYYYLLTNIFRRNDGIDNIHITGGSAEAYFDNQNSIIKYLGISKDTLRKHLEELNKLGLIYYNNIGRIVKDNKVKDANMVYATDEEELKEGLKQSLYYWESEGWKLID